MKSENSALERAVRLVLFTGAITAFAASPAAMAQQEGDDEEDQLELGRQVVTGSRIKRIDLEEARPVVVITRDDIELSGQESVADVLRSSPVNTFGSSREVSGNNWLGQASIDLHGIGGTRSLVLLDGRRMPRSPVSANQFNDLNIIPLAAVDRIEILTDSASAIYGSDAIGGVINIILRKDYDGVEFGAALDRPTREGADADAGAITIGGSTSRGRFLFGADFRSKAHIASADREYARGNPGYDAGAIDYPDAPFEATWYAWENASNVSPWGNTIVGWNLNRGLTYLAAPNCEQVVDPETGERLLLGPYLAANGRQYCGFDYTAFSWETAALKRASSFLHAEYELSPDHTLRVQSVFSRVDHHGRYAPAVGGFVLNEGAAAGLKESFGFDVPYPEFLGPFSFFRYPFPYYELVHRFVGLGNRDFKATNNYFENALMAYGTVGIFDYEIEARHSRYTGREDSCCYAKSFTTSEYVSLGLYNPFDPLSPDNSAAYDNITSNANRDIRGDYRTYSAVVSFDMFDAPAGPVGWAFGAEYLEELYYDIYDPLSAGGDLIGSAGNSGEGERIVKSAFGEAYIPILANLEASAAVRYDSYDDSSGNELSLYFSARYQPTDWLLFRASWGEGFRAPNMTNLYAAQSFSADFGTDLVDCQRAGISAGNCPRGQFDTFSGGNPNLGPEVSTSYNVGFVIDWEPTIVRIDYWNVSIEDGIGISTLQGLINSELRGQCVDTGRADPTIETGLLAQIIECGSGNVIKRSPDDGTLLEAETNWSNTFRSEYGGVDVLLQHELETATAGDFEFSLYGVRMLRVRSRSQSATDWSNSLGESGQVKYSASGLIRWTYGDHTVSAYVRHLDGYVRPEEEFKASSHTEFDLYYRWDTPWSGRITIGVRNLTDEDPELDPTEAPASYDLYSVDGRVPYVSYRHYF